MLQVNAKPPLPSLWSPRRSALFWRAQDIIRAAAKKDPELSVAVLVTFPPHLYHFPYPFSTLFLSLLYTRSHSHQTAQNIQTMQTQQQLCLACSSTIPATVKPASVYRHGCCSRLVCAACLATNPRLTTFCPICEDAKAAFRKGPRSDVTRKGEVVFDASAALEREDLERGEEVPPPPYTEDKVESGTFVVVDNDESGEEEDKSMVTREKRPSLLTRQTSKSAAGAEVDIAPRSADTSHDEPTAELTSFRRKVDPHTACSPSTPSCSGSTRQYWLRKNDTLNRSRSASTSRPTSCACSTPSRAPSSLRRHICFTRVRSCSFQPMRWKSSCRPTRSWHTFCRDLRDDRQATRRALRAGRPRPSSERP